MLLLKKHLTTEYRSDTIVSETKKNNFKKETRYRTMAKRFEMTRKEMFTELVAIATEIERADLVEMLEHEIEVIDKKSSKKKATSDADLALMTAITEALEGVEPKTCTEIIALDERLAGLSTSKMSALLKKLIAEGTVHRAMNGKRAEFSLV